MSNLSKNDVRVIILNNKIEELANVISAMAEPTLAERAIENLYAYTRAMRQPTICRTAFQKMNNYVKSVNAQKLIMETVRG